MTLRQSFLRALIFGLPGIVILTFVATPPAGIPRIALAINPFFMLILLGGLGAWSVTRTGLRSGLLRGDSIDVQTLAKLAGFAVLAGVAVAVADHLATPYWRAEGATQPQSLAEAANLGGLVLGLSYGGVTEEILMRWGLMAGVMAGLMRFLSRENAASSAIAIAAALFAIGHLPALAVAGVETTPALFSRVLLINAVLGLWFGWLYFKRDLESAMSAHMGVHIGAFSAGIALI